MGDNLIIGSVSPNQIRLYYLFVFISFIYLLIKFKNNKFSLIILFLFYNGLFSFINKDVQNIYRIALTIISIYFLIRTNSLTTTKNIKFVVFAFISFSLLFFLSASFNDDYISIALSQYSRYFVLFSLFIILLKHQRNEKFKHKTEYLVYNILLVQIVLSVLKFLIIGSTEFIVGSIGSQGGALATPLPILALMFLWLKKNGKFSSRDWLIILGFIFIGFVSLKRAIWFIIPIILALFMFYIPKQKISRKILIFSLFAVPLVFYLGVRFNKTLNKEGVVGGSFDPSYALHYAQTYMFGEEESEKKGNGRGGATLLLLDKYISGELSQKDWFGYGLRFMYNTSYDEFQEHGFGISTKGAATGVFQSYVTGGFAGIFVTLAFALSMLIKTQNKRLRYVLIGFFSWEYFFYTGIILREYSVGFILIYIIVFSNKIMVPKINKENKIGLRNIYSY